MTSFSAESHAGDSNDDAEGETDAEAGHKDSTQYDRPRPSKAVSVAKRTARVAGITSKPSGKRRKSASVSEAGEADVPLTFEFATDESSMRDKDELDMVKGRLTEMLKGDGKNMKASHWLVWLRWIATLEGKPIGVRKRSREGLLRGIKNLEV